MKLVFLGNWHVIYVMILTFMKRCVENYLTISLIILNNALEQRSGFELKYTNVDLISANKK